MSGLGIFQYIWTLSRLSIWSLFNALMIKKHFTAITCFIAITYKVLYRKLIYAYLSRIVSNKTYALFHLENLSKKSPLPGKFLCFPPLVKHKVFYCRAHSPLMQGILKQMVSHVTTRVYGRMCVCDVRQFFLLWLVCPELSSLRVCVCFTQSALL